MKKKGLIVASLLILISIFTGLVACQKKVDNFDLVKKNVSYMQENLLTGKSTSFSANIAIGKKEKQFIADGKVGEMYNYCVLKVIPTNLDMFAKKFSYVLSGEKGELSGELSKNILGASFGVDILDFSKIGAIKNLKITCEKTTEDVVLKSLIDGCITSNVALEYAYNAVKDVLSSEINGKEFNREVYIKFINDKTSVDSPYYWYISMMKDNENYISVLINPKDGKVISKKM